MARDWTPDAIGRLTIVQLIAMGSEKPPRHPCAWPDKITDAATYMAVTKIRQQERESWDFDLATALQGLRDISATD